MAELLYRNVYYELKSRISSGKYPAGTLIPSEAKLKKEFGVSAITIRRAIQELVLDGFIERRQGIGSFVRDTSKKMEVVGLSGFTTDVASGRLRIVRTLLVDDMIPGQEDIAEKLRVQPGSMLRHLVRLDTIGGSPFSIDEAFIPPALAEKINREIASSPLFMYLWQEAAGLDFVHTHYDIWIEEAGQSEQEILGVEPLSPLLITGELVFDVDEIPSLWIVSKYPSDRCRLSGIVKLLQKKTEHGMIGE